MKSVQMHRVNFFEPKPIAIRCLSYDDSTSRIAVGRADYSIEIWDVKELPYQETVIPGDQNISVETITFCNGRLFSGGLHGYVLEYDIKAVLPKSQILMNAGQPIWCMAANKKKTHLAVCNDDGNIVLIDIVGEMVFDKRFNRQEGAIFCLSWHRNGHVIATGSVDTIRTWDVETGHVINRIMLSRKNKNTPTVVWCIALLRDLTIVSGDSAGKVSFWEGNTGTLINNSANLDHEVDILSLTVSEDEDIIYASGVEPTITAYMKSQSNGMWMKSVQRVVHTHDIRALQLVGDLLISGGDDCNLVCTKYPPKIVLTFFPFCQKTFATVASEASCILIQYPSSVEFWKIGNKIPVHLLRAKPKPNEQIISSSISNDGKWLAYSTRHHIHMFSLFQDPKVENSISLSKVEVGADIPASKILLFNKDSSRLYGYDGTKILVMSCDLDSLNIEQTIDEDSESAGQIHLMVRSSDNSYLACGCYDGNVAIYCLNSLKLFCKLPLYKCQATALTFDPSSENLIVCYSDRKVVEYNIKKQAYTSWSKQEMLEEFQKASLYPIISMCFCDDKLYLLEENSIYVFDRANENTPVRKKGKYSEDTENVFPKNSFVTLERYQHLSSIHSLKDEIVLVQIPSNSILESLPPPIWKKLYGT